MHTYFDICNIETKELYFKLNNSFQIIDPQIQSPTYKYAGIYAIFKNEVCVYVGQSQNLASRLAQHLTGKYATCTSISVTTPIKYHGDFDCKWFYKESKEKRKLILLENEKILINRLKPTENLITFFDCVDVDENLIIDSMIIDDGEYPADHFKSYPSFILTNKKSNLVISNSESSEWTDHPYFMENNKLIVEAVEKGQKERFLIKEGFISE